MLDSRFRKFFVSFDFIFLYFGHKIDTIISYDVSCKKVMRFLLHNSNICEKIKGVILK